MAITLFGSASNPADNGSYYTSPVAVTPPGSMQAGDLVFVTVCYSGTSGTLTWSNTGGQTWELLGATQVNQTRNRMRSFWCVFNGTWSADPSWQGSGTSNVIAKMVVFRPDGGTGSTWAIDVPISQGTYAAPASPYTVTNTGITTQYVNAVAIAAWTSADDNTWTGLSGTGWATAGGAQIRNTYGTYDQSAAHAYRVMATPGATGDVSYNQLANAADAGTRLIMAFHEVASPTTIQAIFTATADQPASVESGSAVRAESVLEMVGTQPTPQVNTGDTVTPAIITGTLTPLDPAMQGPRLAEAEVITAQASQVEPTLAGSAVAVQSAQTITGAQLTPTLSGTGVVVQSIITGTLSQPTPTPVAGDFPDATPTPDAIAGLFSVANAPATSISAIGVVSENTAEASAVEPGYVGTTTGEKTVTVNPIDAVADMPELSLFAQAVAAIQAAITGLFQTLAPVLAGTLLYVAEPVLAVADQPTPTVTAGAVITPTPITAQSSAVDPVMAGAVIYTPTPIAGTFNAANVAAVSIEPRAVVAEVTATGSLVDPTVVLGGDVLIPILETIDALASLPAPSVTLFTAFTPEPIEGTFSQPDPTIIGIIPKTVTPDPITGAFSQVAGDYGTSKVVGFEFPIPAYYELCAPTLSISSAPILIQEAFEVTGSQPAPTVTARAVVAVNHIAATLELVDPTLGTAGNITVRPAIIALAGAIDEPTITADANVALEPIDATGEPIDPTTLTAVETIVQVEPIDALAELLATTDTAEGLVTLEPIAATASQPTQTEAGTALVALEPIEAVADQPEPSIATAGNITVRPDPIVGILSVASDAATAIDTIVVIAEVSGSLTLPDPLVWNTPVTVEVEPIAGEFSQPDPTIDARVAGTQYPSPITGSLSLPTPTVGIGITVETAEISATASLPTPQIMGRLLYEASPITGQFSLPTPTVSASIISVTASPAPITGVVSLSFLTDTSADAELIPTENEGTASQPTPTVVLTNAPSVAVSPITGTFTLPVPTVLSGGSITLTLEPIDGAFSITAVTLTEDKTIEVEPVEATASLVEPYVAVGDVTPVTVTLSPIAGTFAQVEPTLTLTLQPVVALEPIDATASLVAPSTSFPWTIATQNIEGQFSAIAPSVLINSALLVPAPLTAIGTPLEPYIIATAGKFKKPILKDVTGRKRIYDVTILDPIADAAERQGIIDIYIGRN